MVLSLSFPSEAVSSLLLSEVVTSNVESLLDEDGDSPDWIELHNDGTEAVDLTGHFLTDDRDDLNKWEFPGVSLEAGGFLVVFASGKDRAPAAGEAHTNFQLKNGGEFLALVGPDKTTILDQFDPEIPQLGEDQSYGVRDRAGAWVLHFFEEPTPNAANTGGSVAEEVLFSVTGQPFTESVEVALSTRSGSKITYTTDGKRPTLFNGMTYSEPLVLTETTILSAAISSGPLVQEVFFKVTPELAATTSNLPLVIVESDGTIGSNYDEMLLAILEPSGEDERTKVEGLFTLTGRGQIKTRGSSTQGFPKKSYRLEFQDDDDEDKVMKPLGMPAESDWILSGRYEEDRSLIRNEFTYALSRSIGRYAARTVFCEVYVSRGEGPVDVEDYVGVYSFMEAMKRDADRIDIDELGPEDNEEPEVSGGYIFKVDRSGPNDTQTSAGGQGIVITEPSRDELTDAQLDYLRGYLGDMADSLDSTDPETGYPAFIDVPSWIDHHLVNTIMLNVDSLRLSTYFYKPRNGKVFGGPVWDFNISSGSRDRFGSPPRPSKPDVWRGISGDRGTTFFTNGTQRWWGDLFEDRDFQQAYCDRWNELRQGPFSTESLHALIDSMADELREAQPRNEERWPAVSPEYGGWQGELDHLKDWLATRADWIDRELVAPPTVTPEGGALGQGETVKLQSHWGSLFNPTTVYYTTDGTDPRLPGGELSEAAIAYSSGGIVLEESTTIVAREYMPNYSAKADGPDQQWSAPAEVQFVVGTEAAAAGNLVVSELMYHPENPSDEEAAAGYTNDDDFEYVELTNIGAAAIDLLGVTAEAGIEFTFGESLILEPGASVVIVANLEAFRQRHGDAIPVGGVYTGRLANSGERLAWAGATGESIVDLRYDDNDPWPSEADGDGVSLELVGPDGNPDPNESASWAASVAGGTPGSTDGGGVVDPPVGTTYEDWAAAAIPAGMEAGKLADPDRDGRANLLEYVLGTDPATPDGGDALVIGVDDEGVFVSYTEGAAGDDVSVVIQTAANLADWEPFTGSTEIVPGGGAEDPDRVVARLPADAAGHVRLMVE